ncbi:hypothetical protein [Staphylococcus chromogenes]|uniref:hypothetical protein n=1 Tax=Staphylococcus chromogenes TaxID=46126 RepID=UPI000D1B4B36|nr:hypothetical protein [Staphylococcus chromogenes]PTG08606.1 hypothetical protein BU648_03450 [Staphylococcus chromogenes]
MVKIKVKKEMTLPELIKWAGENRIKNKKFIGSSGGGIYFYFDEDSWISIDEPNLIEPDETFEVEVEEEITEETKIPNLVEAYEYMQSVNCSGTMYNTSIQEEKTNVSKAFYMLNDDYTMTLIWRDGGMVE